MNLRGNIKIAMFLATVFLTLTAGSTIWAQTTIVNYDFNGAVAGTPCAATPTTNAAGVTATLTTSTNTCTAPGGTTTTPTAFTQNGTAGTAASITGFATGSTQYFQIQLSGVGIYSSYQLYFQALRSNTGPANAIIQYSTDGTTFTDFQTVAVPNATPFGAYNIDLSSVVALNNLANVSFRIVGTGGTGAGGTFRIDNFQVQAIGPTAAGTTAGGRVTEANGRGIFRALVTMTDSMGNQRQAYTNQLGYYNFEDVAGGQVYVFTAQHRRYQFDQPTQVQFVGEEQDGINFVGSPFGVFRSEPWNFPTKGLQ